MRGAWPGLVEINGGDICVKGVVNYTLTLDFYITFAFYLGTTIKSLVSL